MAPAPAHEGLGWRHLTASRVAGCVPTAAPASRLDPRGALRTQSRMPMVRTPGASIAYRRTGRGPAVLLIQGVGVVGHAWRPQIDALADRFTLVDLDNRGIEEARSRAAR